MTCYRITQVITGGGGGSPVAITSIDVAPTLNPGEFSTTVNWVDANGAPQVTTDLTPFTIPEEVRAVTVAGVNRDIDADLALLSGNNKPYHFQSWGGGGSLSYAGNALVIVDGVSLGQIPGPLNLENGAQGYYYQGNNGPVIVYQTNNEVQAITLGGTTRDIDADLAVVSGTNKPYLFQAWGGGGTLTFAATAVVIADGVNQGATASPLVLPDGAQGYYYQGTGGPVIVYQTAATASALEEARAITLGGTLRDIDADLALLDGNNKPIHFQAWGGGAVLQFAGTATTIIDGQNTNNVASPVNLPDGAQGYYYQGQNGPVIVYQTDQSTLYNANDSLTGTRTLDGSGFSLTFDNLNLATTNAQTVIWDAVSGNYQFTTAPPVAVTPTDFILRDILTGLVKTQPFAASSIPVLDANDNYTATDLEGVLAEIAAVAVPEPTVGGNFSFDGAPTNSITGISASTVLTNVPNDNNAQPLPQVFNYTLQFIETSPNHGIRTIKGWDPNNPGVVQTWEQAYINGVWQTPQRNL